MTWPFSSLSGLCNTLYAVAAQLCIHKAKGYSLGLLFTTRFVKQKLAPMNIVKPKAFCKLFGKVPKAALEKHYKTPVDNTSNIYCTLDQDVKCMKELQVVQPAGPDGSS